ncbi:E3 SUMO-protein ligase RanBP2 isoform X2 [Belonocnema kinseyi]|uniref:E3 SUMO-protein ligase RanBP2 isoform X2 n=1 Tax=Belonocnema kinseyi TaxID=2817044 RepID=UPI00143D1270|nr:E3 SUMO-protein ligase RanBP2 isoform X2 [Belonocnema kinseyi]
MFRTKKDVDRHVQDVFRKLKDENERNLRCYNIAKLYFQVQDYEAAKRYVSSYLEVRTESAGAHKLLGQILEALGQKEDALSQYRISLELESRQDDLVLKVCELLADMDVGVDVNRARYWVERADKQFPHHPIVFQLKEKLLTVDKPNNDGEDLKLLIASELSVRPKDVQLRVKLLKHYMEKNKLDEAYKHAFDVEATQVHRDNVSWYQVLCDLLTKCKSQMKKDWSFWVFYISALERFVALNLKEQGNILNKSLAEATQAVFNFDQALYEAKSQNFSTNPLFMDNMFSHMWGQLNLHIACLMLRKTKREQGSWGETGRLCAPLFLTALHVAPVDPTSPWAVHIKDWSKNQVQIWHKEGSYRCSQAGHVLQDYARDEPNRLMEKIDKFCTGAWRERIFQRIFISRLHLQIKTSYFSSQRVANPPMRLCTQNELKRFDEVSEEVWPASLHHQVWLGISNRPRGNQKNPGPHPHTTSHLFPELQFSAYNLNQSAPDSLSRLDIEAFLNAAVLCTHTAVEEQQRSSFMNPERLPTLPADLTNTLCTSYQEKWWAFAYKMYRRIDWTMNDLGEIRQELQRGLEVVRCIGNHGLHPNILVHLARIFHHRVKVLKERNPEHCDISALEVRCELYWSAAIPLLERMQNNQPIRTTSQKLFDYQGKDMSSMELMNAMEEGRLLLAQKHVRDKEYERAIDALQVLKCPEASFEQGKIYRKLADDLVSCMPKESLTSETRSQHVIILTKARNCFYLTLDRLRSPEADQKHPLNAELFTHIADIENELKRIDPDLSRNGVHRNDCDGMSEESYSSAHSNEEIPVAGTSLGLDATVHNFLQTPQRNSHRTPKQSSTPSRPQHHDILELSRNRTEARPSPERLDAQIRQMMNLKENIVQTVMDQNRALMESNKVMMEKLEELRKEVSDLRLETQKQKPAAPAANHNLEEDLYLFGEEDYGEYNYQNSAAPQPANTSIPANIFAQTQRHPYSNLVYPPPTLQGQAIGYYQGNYQGGLSFNDPNHHISSLYAANVYPVPPIYPRHPVDPTMNQNIGQAMGQPIPPPIGQPIPPPIGHPIPPPMGQTIPPPIGHPIPPPVGQTIPKMPESILQQSLFPQVPPAIPNQPYIQQIPVVQKLEATKIETAKEPIRNVPVNKAPPVNVVITSSDVLPTTAPSVQPVMSVTIPAQHRLGGTTVTTSSTNEPHNYQISMPLQAMIPTTVNLPPLSETMTMTITSPNSRSTAGHNTSTTGSLNNSIEICNEVEHDPIPDFVPIIPLPDEVAVTTGEEGEITLFSMKAKLFRFTNKEWKERGVGEVKLLKNKEGKVRLLMRRDQVFKICANHMLARDMELTAMKNNSKAWVWVANDFADEEVRLEKLCIRFKTDEDALAFKECFDQAKISLPISPEKPKESSSSVDNKQVEKKVENKMEKGTIKLGGFSFASEPILKKPIAEKEEKKKVVQKEKPAKVSPFAQFSFGKTTVAPKEGTSALSSALTGFGSSPAVVTQASTPTVISIGKTGETQSPQSGNMLATSKTLRRPHGPAQESSTPGREITEAGLQAGETSIYSGKANLMHVNNVTNVWEDKGTGQINIFFNSKRVKMRLIMLTENNTKLSCNHPIFADSKFSFRATSDTVVNWIVPNTSNPKKHDSFAIAFKTHEQGKEFLDAVHSYQRKLGKAQTSAGQTTVKSKATDKKEPLSAVFKPAAGSWECKMCYIRNDGDKPKCVACDNPAPGKPAESESSAPSSQSQNTSSQSKSSLLDQFKPAAGSWTCEDCYMVNKSSDLKCPACNRQNPSVPSKPQTPLTPSSQLKPLSEVCKPAAGSWTCQGCYMINQGSDLRCPACDGANPSAPSKPKTSQTPSSQLKPLSEVCKPAAGSWTCQGCYMVNKGSDLYCPACDSPKDPSLPPKPKTSIFGTSTDTSTPNPFTFGIPQANKDTSSPFPFSLSNASNNKTQGAADAEKSSISSIFGGPKKSEPINTKFSFGVQQQRPTTPPNKEATYVFGSPGKSFDFQFNAKTPMKSPGVGETSEDEVVESDDIYFAPVIPLPDKVDVKTGEEEEEVLYSHRAKLYRFDINTKEWKERGLGDIKLLKHRQNKKLRLVMRRDQILKLCLNHAVTADLEVSAKDDKTWMWSAADYSEGEIEYMQFACRFKTPEIAGEFKTAMDKAQKGEDPTNELNNLNLSEKPAATGKTRLEDVEIVYEVQVTNQEKEDARKLQLPENFYSYKYKDDCPGCIGCQESSKSLFETKPAEKVVGVLNFSKSDSLVTEKLSESTSLGTISASVSTPTSQPVFSFMGAANKPSTGLFGTPTASITPPASATPALTSTKKEPSEKSSAGFLFGGSPFATNAVGPADQQKDSSTFKKAETTLENLKVCSPAIKLPTSAAASNFSFADGPKSSTPIFGTKQPLTSQGGEKSIFGLTPSAAPGSIFGGTVFGGQKDSTVSGSTTGSMNFGEAAQNKFASSTLFGGGLTTNSATTTPPTFGSQTDPLSFSSLKNTSTTAPVYTNVFGGNSSPIVSGGFGTGGSNLSFGNSSGNAFGVKKAEETGDKVSFLPTENAVSFSTLAAKSDQNAFKVDPNFAFEGTGTSVFGRKSLHGKNSINTPNKAQNDSKQEDDENEEEGDENDHEHDPQFEPIIPLPDAIEVRTGEEDEEKAFCQRAKLYRFDADTKEWKERGVGEMKILHHAERGTYRILLRREQVHKVVCNMLLTADVEFQPLQTSDRAWMWAGMNYYEGETNLEKLAIRFKNPELAHQFKEAIDKAQQALRERPSTNQDGNDSENAQLTEYEQEEEDDEEYGEEGEEEDLDCEEVEEEEEPSIMFEKRATLFVQEEGEEGWKNLGMGGLRIVYDSEIFGSRIVMEVDNGGDVISNTVISMDTTMQVNGKECVWTASDYALDPPARRLLRAVFASHQCAEEMYLNFEDGQDYARGADIRDPPIYIPGEE